MLPQVAAGATFDRIVGRSLGEFVVRERIGEGGFGAVYRAIQPALGREAVVKVLHASLAAAPAATERFLREARLASKLDHPYAAHVYAFGVEPDGQHWIAMELVRGTPLDDVLRHQGALTLERLSPLLDRICEVVHTAHEQGIVHRDLKPANVMVLSRAGRLLPKLLDFGIAKGLEAPVEDDDPSLDSTALSRQVPASSPAVPVVRAASFAQTLDASTGDDGAATGPTLGAVTPGTSKRTGQLTQEGALMGSPLYMAPEQWIDAGEVDDRADLYALGVLAYECLTGKPPFTGKTVQQIATAHAKSRPPELGESFPRELDAVFAKALAKRAGERYATALEFAEAFRLAAGIATEPARLPALDDTIRIATLNEAPQPIAEALSGYEGARNAHQARDALALVARTLVRYIGLLAVACRSRVEGRSGGAELMRALALRELADREWLDLARALTADWRARRDAYPVPELVTALHDTALCDDLGIVLDLREHDAPGEGALIPLLEESLARLARSLEALAFLRDYPLIVTTADGSGESWMGVRHARRRTVTVRGKRLEGAQPFLLDKDGAPVLSLAPLFRIAEPTPGAPRELFLFDGRDRRGAKLVAWPIGFECHDDSVRDWFRAQLGSLEERAATVDDEVAPYRGLSAFSARDSALFFGREAQVDAFLNRLQLQPLLAVVGPSGAGKSSFVHAGVVPALPAEWRTVSLRPGASPLAALAARLEHASIGSRDALHGLRQELARDRDALGALLRDDAAAHGPIVLVVDQLEELFTLCHDDTERRLFAEAVAAAARDAEDRVRVIFTLRDDFLVRTEQVEALRNRIGQGLQLLTVPVAEDLRRILVEPARRSGYEFEDSALPTEMVAEVADQPGALALLSFTAQKLWELRDRHFKQLTRVAYKTLGGVGGALAQHAEQTLEAMPSEERALAREAFRHLVTSLDTRAVVARSDLRQLLGGDERGDGVIEKLVAARLLVVGDRESGAETVEVVHEALLAAWPRLVEWRREDREGARFREQLRSAAKQWHERQRVRGLLWRGDAFAELVRWRSRHTGPLTDLEAAFADASARDAARGRRNLRLLVALGFAALGVIVIVLVASRSRIAAGKLEAENANTKLQDNLERQWEAQGRLLVLEGDPLKGLAALAHAGDLGAHGRGHDFLIAEAVQASGGALHTLVHAGPVRAPSFSHDGTRVVTGNMDGKARIWDASSGALVFQLSHTAAITRTAFSPDDATVLTASLDGTARWWNARTGEELRRFDHGKSVWCALFSPDGKLALTGAEDDQVVLWDLASRAEKLRVHGEGAGTTACAFSPDGVLFAAGDVAGVVRVWRTSTGEQVQRHADQKGVIYQVAFSPDGSRLVAGSDDHSAATWDLATGRLEHRLQHDDSVFSVSISPDGKRVVTGSLDRTAAVWDAATGQRLFVLAGHTGGIQRAAFSPDGSHIVTASEDATTRLWDAAGGRLLATWWHDDFVFDFAFDARGERAVTASNDGKAVIWAVRRQDDGVSIRGPRGTMVARLSPDGATVAIGDREGAVRVYDSRSGGMLAELSDPVHGVIEDLAFDATGRYVATATNSAALKIWDTHAPKSPPRVLAGRSQSSADTNELEWRDDLIVTASDDGYLRLWKSSSGSLDFEQRTKNAIGLTGATFARDAKSITALTYDGVIQTWSLQGQLLASEQDPAQPWRAVFDPSGKRMLTLSSKRSIEIHDVATKALQLQLFGHLGHVTGASWSPDGAFVATTALDGSIRLWDASTGDQLEVIHYPGRQAWVDFAPDGRFLAAEDDGLAMIRQLPTYRGGAEALQQLLRCRVPYIVRDDRLQLRDPSDRTGCKE
jgi:WD40 repeat protein/serine/threonine protein kinase